MGQYSGIPFFKHSVHGWVYKNKETGKHRKMPSNIVTEMDAIKWLDAKFNIGQFS